MKHSLLILMDFFSIKLIEMWDTDWSVYPKNWVVPKNNCFLIEKKKNPPKKPAVHLNDGAIHDLRAVWIPSLAAVSKPTCSCHRPRAADRKWGINLCLTLKETWERCYYLMCRQSVAKQAPAEPKYSVRSADTVLGEQNALAILSLFWHVGRGTSKVNMTVKW